MNLNNTKIERTVYLVRHGERSDHHRRAFDSRGSHPEERNPHLSVRGVKQASLVGKFLAEELMPEAEASTPIIILTSGYWRCLQTSNQVVRCLEERKISSQLYKSDWVREVQNKLTSSKREELDKEANHFKLGFHLDISPEWHRVPLKTEEAIETKMSAFQRALDFWDKLAAGEFDPIENKGQKVVFIVITHAFFVTSLICSIGQLLYNKEILECGVTKVVISPNGKSKLLLTNYGLHLQKL